MRTLEERVGQKLMFGISGTAVTGEIVKIFRKTHAGGLILFRRNFKTAPQSKSLIENLESALGRRLLVAVDHEGGRVVHLGEAVTLFPSNLTLGATGNEDYARRQGEIEAVELKRLGLDINLAPCLDVLTETFSPNIGIRSYGRDPELVARLGRARIQAMQTGGISACAKHFPGQGHSPLDAHLKLPCLDTSLEEMRRVHLRPFAEAIQAGVDLVMSSHPVYSQLDPTGVPATFSRRIVHDCLRKELGFQNVIISDDLEMGALKGICPIGEAACRTAQAGH
ncbi:MAG: beta-N-acetylhexosaminidase, partial [Candidatus Omnitrophica bacterium]|nr:beta-N-acetylhexosaminidase [Candidatus Omnitrophota bacterium]